MADKPKPQPGDLGWTHPDVRGDTNPTSIKALIDALEIQERIDADRIRGLDKR